MPEQWIMKDGPTNDEVCKQAFEKWWERTAKDRKGWEEIELLTIKKIAFSAWRYQHEVYRNLIKDMLDQLERHAK